VFMFAGMRVGYCLLGMRVGYCLPRLSGEGGLLFV
jgi:hypothetical protein